MNKRSSPTGLSRQKSFTTINGGVEDFRVLIKENSDLKQQLKQQDSTIDDLQRQLDELKALPKQEPIEVPFSESNVPLADLHLIEELTRALEEAANKHAMDLIDKDDLIEELHHELEEMAAHHASELEEKEHIIAEVSHDLLTTQELCNNHKRQVDEYRVKFDESQSELFIARDELIALSTQLSRHESHMSASVSSEYDLLHSIIGDLHIAAEGDPEAPLVSSAQTSVESADDVIADLKQQLEREQARSAELLQRLDIFEGELNQSTMIIVGREREVSSLIAAQQTFLQDQAYLRSDLQEIRQQKIDMQSQITQLEEKNRFLKVETIELKNKIQRMQLDNVKSTPRSKSNSPGITSISSSDDLEGDLKDSFDYENTLVSDYDMNIVQKLLLDYTLAKLRYRDLYEDRKKLKAAVAELEILSCDLKYKLANALVDLDTWEYSSATSETPPAVVKSEKTDLTSDTQGAAAPVTLMQRARSLSFNLGIRKSWSQGGS